ncbi:MAG: energy transducer TonB [Bacteroidetes bacterium]|nr:energy transducer TonB [Bacteroidota bacterium]MDA0972595.1 energy transducer TonB [Bacteroidota bacterium]
MELLKDKDRRAGLIGTLLFHIALLLIFMMVGLSQPNPLPEDEGAMIELGWTDTGSGDVESQVISPNEVVQETAQEQVTPTETESVEEDVVTQEESPVTTPKVEPEKPKETKPKEEPKPKPSQALQDAMTNVFNSSSSGGSEGENESGSGNTGRPDGSIEGRGVMGGSGNNWELAGRGFLGGATVTEKPREEGKVVLNIWVDKSGKVTRTSPNLSESNTTSQYLFNLAKSAAMNAKFNADPSAAVEQKGKLTFFFLLQ